MGEDLYLERTLRADPLKDYPPTIARTVYVTASSPAGTVTSFTWANAQSFTARFYYRDIGASVPSTSASQSKAKSRSPSGD